MTQDAIKFCNWFNTGRLKQGDRISTTNSIENAGINSGPRLEKAVSGETLLAAKPQTSDMPAAHTPTDRIITKAEQTAFLSANDNQPLTVFDILRDNTPTQVYNFEVESRVGEITHNYFVGADAAWVHNARIRDPKLRKKQHDKDPNCMYCGILTDFKGPSTGPRTTRFSCEHIQPQSRGGSDSPLNIGTACVPCNSKRINMR